MKVILTHEVSGLGAAGDVVDVKDGYARNYLFPRKLATAWTAGGQKQVDSITKARESPGDQVARRRQGRQGPSSRARRSRCRRRPATPGACSAR
jgi:large subunit ribosomal protein L9